MFCHSEGVHFIGQRELGQEMISPRKSVYWRSRVANRRRSDAGGNPENSKTVRINFNEGHAVFRDCLLKEAGDVSGRKAAVGTPQATSPHGNASARRLVTKVYANHVWSR